MAGPAQGTLGYMSPEQARGEGSTDDEAKLRAIDVYGLGAILHALLTGAPPFKGAGPAETLEMIRSDQEAADPRQLAPEVPQGLAAVCLKALRKRAEKRFATVNEFRDAIEAALADCRAERSKDHEQDQFSTEAIAMPKPAPRREKPTTAFVALALLTTAATCGAICLGLMAARLSESNERLAFDKDRADREAERWRGLERAASQEGGRRVEEVKRLEQARDQDARTLKEANQREQAASAAVMTLQNGVDQAGRELMAKQGELKTMSSELGRRDAVVKSLRDDVGKADAELSKKRGDLKSLQSRLEGRNAIVMALEADVDRHGRELQARQDDLEAAKGNLETSRKDLATTRSRLEKAGRLSARLAWSRAQTLHAEKNDSLAMLWLAEGLRQVGPDDGELEAMLRSHLTVFSGQFPPTKPLFALEDAAAFMHFAWSDDQKTVVGFHNLAHVARLWDASTGKDITPKQFGVPLGEPHHNVPLAFSHDLMKVVIDCQKKEPGSEFNTKFRVPFALGLEGEANDPPLEMERGRQRDSSRRFQPEWQAVRDDEPRRRHGPTLGRREGQAARPPTEAAQPDDGSRFLSRRRVDARTPQPIWSSRLIIGFERDSGTSPRGRKFR